MEDILQSKKEKRNFINNEILEQEDKKENSPRIKEKLNKIILKIKNELDNNFKTKRKKGLKNFKKNENDYSYIHSLIQCMGGIPDILLFLIKNKNDLYNNAKKKPKTFAFFKIIDQLYEDKHQETIGNSASFITIIGHCFPFLKANGKNPIDLYHLLLFGMHEELNSAEKNIINVRDDECYNKNSSILENEIIFFNNRNDSFISDTFNSFIKKEIKCTSCNNTFYELDNFYSFDLDAINTYREYNKKTLNINDCLKYYIKPKNIKRICSICHKKSNLILKKTIFESSKILVFVLTRNNSNEEEEMLTIKFNYKEIIDISDYIDSKLIKITAEYLLIGVVAFLFDEKKYVSFCKNLFYNEWICFNEDSIRECNFDDMINSSTPFILFYKRIE